MLSILLRNLFVMTILFLSVPVSSQIHIQFIENKNQWHKNVLYKADIPSGSIFLEDDRFTYCFYEYTDVHDCHHPVDAAGNNLHEQHLEKPEVIHFHAFEFKFKNANQDVKIHTLNEYPHYYNYFIGNDKSKWASNVRCYEVVEYENMYDGINIKMYQTGNNLKYDFILNPGAQVDDINIEINGANKIEIYNENLLIRTSVINITELKPYAYQMIDGIKKEVKCKYILSENKLKFKIGKYNKKLPLIIDPILMFSTYSGSYSNNFGYTATYDSKGHLYSGSTAFGPDYPTTLGAFQTTFAGDSDPANINHGTDIAITKWELDGSAMIYSTLLGGSLDELPHSMYVNSEYELYLYGTTGSSDFPVTSNAYDQTYDGGTSFNPNGLGVSFPTGSDIIVAKLSSDGTDLLGCTYLGGSQNDGINTGILRYNYADEVRGEILLDNNHNVYVVSSTFSSDYPTTSGVFQPSMAGGLDGCITKLNEDLSAVLWSSFIGGTGTDAAYSIVLDSNEDIYISGGTNSTDFHVTSGVINPSFIGGLSDAFIIHISGNGQNILESSYFGSAEYDQAYFVELNGADEVYLFGQTLAPDSTLIFNATYGTPGSGQFISVLDPGLTTLIRSTVFGTGNGVNISPTAFLVDVCDKIYISGWGGDVNQYYGHGGYTTGMDITSPTFQSTTDGSDFYLAVLEDDMSALHYGTFIGGAQSAEHVDGGTSRFSKKGKIYEAVCAGCNYSAGVPPGNSDFPTSSGAWSNTNNHFCNLAVFKFDFMLPITVAEFPLPLHVCASYTHTFDNLSQYANSYLWDFGDGTISTSFEPTHTFDSIGTFYVTLTAFGDSSCNYDDSVVHIINVHGISADIPSDTSICYGQSVLLHVQSDEPAATYVYSSNPAFTDTLNSNINSGYYNASPTTDTQYYIMVEGPYCNYIDTVQIFVRNVNVDLIPDTIICANDTATLHITNLIPSDTLTYLWSPLSSIISGETTNSPLVNPSSATSYNVTITNQYGCTSVETINVDIDDFTINTSVDNITCFGDCDGTVNITPNGLSPYTYIWDNNTSADSITNLCPGNYSVTVTDSVGCKQYFNATITEPPVLDAVITNIVQTQCDSVNNNTGEATVVASGGTPGYFYEWEDGQTTSTAVNLYAHEYYVTVTDSHGCDTVVSVLIDDGSNLEIATNSTMTQCYGYCDGTASVNITQAGTPPYSYTWSNGQTSPSISGLCAGQYIITVIDADYCQRFDYVDVQQPEQIAISAVIDPIICFGDSTNVTAQVVNGGVSPFTYQWNTGTTNQTLINVPAGTYNVTVTDNNGCTNNANITVSQPDLLVMDTVVNPMICRHVCNGYITVNMEGGVAPYAYNWSNGALSVTNSSLCEGYYEVTVSDDLGCTSTAGFYIGVSDYVPPLDVYADDQHIYIGQSTTLHATDNSNYYYLWKPLESLTSAGSANPVASPDETTLYEIYVIDQFGCTNVDTITIFVTDFICDEPYIYVPNAFSPNGDGKNDILYVYSNIIDELYFAIYDRWGEIMFETTDINSGWDGIYKGEPVDPAVFVYYMEAKCLDKKTFVKKGNITLIR